MSVALWTLSECVGEQADHECRKMHVGSNVDQLSLSSAAIVHRFGRMRIRRSYRGTILLVHGMSDVMFVKQAPR